MNGWWQLIVFAAPFVVGLFFGRWTRKSERERVRAAQARDAQKVKERLDDAQNNNPVDVDTARQRLRDRAGRSPKVPR